MPWRTPIKTCLSFWLSHSHAIDRPAGAHLVVRSVDCLLPGNCGRGALTPRGIRCENRNQRGEGTPPTLNLTDSCLLDFRIIEFPL